MVDPRCVDYIRTNRDKYPLEALKAALLKAGVASADVEEAVRLAAAPPPEDIPVTAPPMRRAPPPAGAENAFPPGPAGPRPPASFAEIFPTATPAQDPVRAAAPAAGRAAAPSQPQGILPRMRAILLSPAAFFRAMPRGGGWREPLLFVLAMSLAFAVLQIGLGLALGALSLGPSRAAVTALAAVFSAAGTMLASLIAVVIAAGVSHLVWTFLGSQQPFETSLRCVAFMSALMPVLAAARAIPVAGPWLAMPVSLYGIYLFLPASIEVHGIEKKKAAAAALGVGTAVLLAALVLAFNATRLRQAAKKRPPSLMEASSAAARSLPPLPTAPSPADIQKHVLGKLAQLQAQAAAGTAAGAGSGQAPDPGQALQAVNEALGALGAGAQGPAADTRDLLAALPARIPGLSRTGADRGKQRIGAQDLVTAEAAFQAPDGGTITVQIVDAGSYGGMLAMAFNAAGGQGALSYKSYPGLEQYDAGSRSGSFQIVAAGRFAVKVTGQDVDGKVLRAAMDAVDLDSLARLAK